MKYLYVFYDHQIEACISTLVDKKGNNKKSKMLYHTNDNVQCIIHSQLIFWTTKRICNTAFVNIDVSRQISK